MKYYVDSHENLIIGYDNKIEKIIILDDPINNIYRGSVQKKVKGIGTFIDLGDYIGFTQEKISQSEGESVIVKVIKVPSEKEKALKVSRKISVTGNAMIVFDDDFIKVSSKINAEMRNNLLNFAEHNSFKGVLFRTEAQNIAFESLKEEYTDLKEKLNLLELEKDRLPSPKLLYKEPIVNRINLKENEEILFNDLELFKLYKNLVNSEFDAEFSIKYIPELVRELNVLKGREVALPDGGNIIIEKTLAFTVIDVNSKGYNTINNHEVVRKINLDATKEIVRQILLRNISGAIIVDYIDSDEQIKKEVINLLRKELKQDGKNTTVHGFTRMGLLEMSRKNRGEELSNIWIE